MATSTGAPVVVADLPDRSRFEVTADRDLPGFAQYVLRGRRILFVHTEIDPAFEGQGLGSRLIEAALGEARARDLRVVPLCPFVARYLSRHPELDDIVDHETLTHLDRM